MTNLQQLESYVRYYQELVDCAEQSGRSESVAPLKLKLAVFKDLRDREAARERKP